jgi:hypothetical protein
MSTTPSGATTTSTPVDKVRTALSSRWDSAVPVEFDGSNYPAWRGVNTHPLLHVRSSRGLLGTLLGVLRPGGLLLR